MAELYTQALAANVQVTIWWTLSDIFSYEDKLNGLFTADNPPAPKPALQAYQTAVSELGRAKFTGTLSAAQTQSADIEARQFTDPALNLSLYVAWLNPINTDKTAPLSLPAEQVTVRNLYNAPHVIHDEDDGVNDGKVTVTVGGQPLYIQVDKQ